MKSRVAGAVCAVMVGLIPAVACASDPLPVASSTNIDLSDPDQVIVNAMATMFTWNPTRDASPDAAYRRASIYLSGDLAQQADKAAKPGTGSQWEQWHADGAEITAKVYFVADETPPNADDVVHRVVVIVQSATTQENRLIDEIRHTAWVVANKSNNGWRVTSIQF
jgi:hypothetical protein